MSQPGRVDTRRKLQTVERSKDTLKAFMITCVAAVYHAQHVWQSVVDELN